MYADLGGAIVVKNGRTFKCILVFSKKNTTIEDIDGNQIQVPMFEYDRKKSLFFSNGKILIKDVIIIND